MITLAHAPRALVRDKLVALVKTRAHPFGVDFVTGHAFVELATQPCRACVILASLAIRGHLVDVLARRVVRVPREGTKKRYSTTTGLAHVGVLAPVGEHGAEIETTRRILVDLLEVDRDRSGHGL